MTERILMIVHIVVSIQLMVFNCPLKLNEAQVSSNKDNLQRHIVGIAEGMEPSSKVGKSLRGLTVYLVEFLTPFYSILSALFHLKI